MKKSLVATLWAVIAFCLVVLIFILRSTGASADLKVVDHYDTEPLSVEAQSLAPSKPVSLEKLADLKTQNTTTLYGKIAQFEDSQSVLVIKTTSVETISENTFECLAHVYYRGKKDQPLLVTTTYRLVSDTFVLTGIIY